MTSEDGRFVVVFNGEIYNYPQLRVELEADGAFFRTTSDTEALLHLYARHGAEMLHRLRGMFAFAIWDEARRGLFLARDPYGIKPLYTANDGWTFRFASQVKALLAGGHISRDPEPAGIVGFHLFGSVPEPFTLYRDIRRLEGGCSITVRPGKIDRRRYFDIDPAKRIRYRTDAEYAEHFESLFREAVRCRLRNIDGVAAELSGGLDSSLVVGIAQRLFREGRAPAPRFETFSIKFDDPQADERSFIDDVAGMWGLETNWSPPFFAKFSDFLADIRRYRSFTARPNSVMDTLMHRAMRERGFRVVLTGQGGDQWFGGSPDCFTELLCGFRLVELFRLLRDEAAYPTRVLGRQRLLTLLLRRTLWPLVPPRPKFFINRLRGARLVPPFVNVEFARKLDLERARNASTRQLRGLSFTQRTMYQVLNLGISIHFAEVNERECALAGLEGRHPFYDRRVIEFAFAIPEDQRCRPRATKYIFRQPGHGLLPESVRQRRDKAEFSSLLVHGLEDVTNALGGEGAFGSFDVVQRGWVDAEQFRLVYRERMRNAASANLWPLWSVLELEMWSRECLAAPKSAEQAKLALAKG